MYYLNIYIYIKKKKKKIFLKNLKKIKIYILKKKNFK